MTVKQAIERIADERRLGLYPSAWTLTKQDVRELMDELQSGAEYGAVHAPADEVTAARDRARTIRQDGYAMTFMGVDIYRA